MERAVWQMTIAKNIGLRIKAACKTCRIPYRNDKISYLTTLQEGCAMENVSSYMKDVQCGRCEQQLHGQR